MQFLTFMVYKAYKKSCTTDILAYIVTSAPQCIQRLRKNTYLRERFEGSNVRYHKRL